MSSTVIPATLTPGSGGALLVGLVAVIAVVAVFGIWIWGLADSLYWPDWAFRRARLNKTLWTVAYVVFTPISLVVYVLWLRGRLNRATTEGPRRGAAPVRQVRMLNERPARVRPAPSVQTAMAAAATAPVPTAMTRATATAPVPTAMARATTPAPSVATATARATTPAPSVATAPARATTPAPSVATAPARATTPAPSVATATARAATPPATSVAPVGSAAPSGSPMVDLRDGRVTIDLRDGTPVECVWCHRLTSTAHTHCPICAAPLPHHLTTVATSGVSNDESRQVVHAG